MTPSPLSAKLKSLGVKVGASAEGAPPRRDAREARPYTIESVVGGKQEMLAILEQLCGIIGDDVRVS